MVFANVPKPLMTFVEVHMVFSMVLKHNMFLFMSTCQKKVAPPPGGKESRVAGWGPEGAESPPKPLGRLVPWVPSGIPLGLVMRAAGGCSTEGETARTGSGCTGRTIGKVWVQFINKNHGTSHLCYFTKLCFKWAK